MSTLLRKTERRTLKEMQELIIGDSTHLSTRLFGPHTEGLSSLPLIDFQWDNYLYFLEHVGSLDDLVDGLAQLSPFADDALDAAEGMSHMDFADFKIALPQERRAAHGDGVSRMPKKFHAILLPKHFIIPIKLSKQAAASLMVTTMRYLEVSTG